MKNNKRAIRRSHRERLLKKRRHYWGRTLEDNVDLNLFPKIFHKVIDTPKVCSCPLCGNPRKHRKEETRQEQISRKRFERELQMQL